MPPKKTSTIWPAAAHTIAKIQILEGYLQAWFPILGRVARGQDLLYIDGFAGPGRYTNYPTGSPVAALRSAAAALSASGSEWNAGDIHCAFIELDRERFEHLDQHVQPFRGIPGLQIHLLNTSFVEGLAALKAMMERSFTNSWPLFAFLDPFGATGVPFATVADILSSPRSEVLINFDADSIARIFRAGDSASHERHLNAIFGDVSWKAVLPTAASFQDQCRTILALYKTHLRSLPNVRYLFSFEMSKSGTNLEYYLVFASQHARGLERMKEAMRRIDQTGEYRFADAHVGRPMLFRFDHPEEFSVRLHHHFSGQEATYAEVLEFTLNETPFVSPKSMLKLLELQGLLTIVSTNPKRRRGTFREDSIVLLIFNGNDPDG